MIDNIIRIIGEVVVFALGAGIGAMWGISRHVELLDWLEARTIRRWMQAMQSLGYEQWRIDQVLEQMGQRIMVNIPPPPDPPKKEDLTQSPESDKVVPSLDAQLAEKEIGVLCREELVDDFVLMEQICLEYADKLKEAAEEPDGFLFKALADQIRDELLQRSEHNLKHVVVDISWKYIYIDKYIQVKFDLDFV